jgi:hypothetical protein
MVKFHKLCRRCLWIAVVFGILFFSTIGWSSLGTPTLAGRVRRILTQAESIRLIEYRAYNTQTHQNSEPLNEKVFAKEEFSRISQAFPFLGFCDSPACGFIPHHALICTLPDGRNIVIHICLSCDGIQFDDEPYRDLPFSWHHGIVALLADCSMPYKHKSGYQVE